MILLDQVSLVAGKFQLHKLGLRVEQGEYAVLMGKTGCGKSTLLEALCGVRQVASGEIWLGGREVTRLAPADRGLGYVPQDLALFPNLTVFDHLAFALEVRGAAETLVRERVDEMSQLLGIAHLLPRYPQGLSGGEAQRVALGRALAFHPSVLLLDEPLSALDEATRGDMVELLRGVQRRTKVTVLHVTHSRHEAEALADRLFQLEAGELREIPRKAE